MPRRKNATATTQEAADRDPVTDLKLAIRAFKKEPTTFAMNGVIECLQALLVPEGAELDASKEIDLAVRGFLAVRTAAAGEMVSQAVTRYKSGFLTTQIEELERKYGTPPADTDQTDDTDQE